jgi:hypothetical protein
MDQLAASIRVAEFMASMLTNSKIALSVPFVLRRPFPTVQQFVISPTIQHRFSSGSIASAIIRRCFVFEGPLRAAARCSKIGARTRNKPCCGP